MKKACLYIHRYCGWIVGVAFFILCLTGCLLAIQPEIEYWAEPSRLAVPERPGETPMTLGELIKAFERHEEETFEEPTTVRVLRIQTSSNLRKAWYAFVSAKNSKQDWAYVAYVDPFTGQGVAYGPGKAYGFMRAIRKWHTSLAITSLGVLNEPILWLSGDTTERDRLGSRVAGLLSLLAAVALLAGFVRWWPKWKKNKNLLNSFRPLLNRGKFRANYDVHNVGGFYALALLLLLSLSGAWIAVPWFRSCCDTLVGYEAKSAEPSAAGKGGGMGLGNGNGAGRGMGQGQGAGAGHGMGQGQGAGERAEEDTTNYGEGVLAGRSPNAGGFSPRARAALKKNTAFLCENILDTPASLDAIIKGQQELTPSNKGYDVIVPELGSDRAVTITKYGGFADFSAPDMYYWDQYTGELLGKTTFGDLSFGEQFHALIMPFHKGNIFGSLSRYILFIASLIGVILAITGYTHMAFRYRTKWKAGQKKLATASANGVAPSTEETETSS